MKPFPPRRLPNEVMFLLGSLSLSLWLLRELFYGPSLLATLIVAATTLIVIRTAEPVLPGDDTA